MIGVPGLVGWLGCREQPLAYPAVLTALLTNSYQKIVDVQGVDRGQVSIIHPDINPAGYGQYFDPVSRRAIAFWGEFYGAGFERCASGEEVCRTVLEQAGANPIEGLDKIDGSFILFLQEPGRQIIASDRLSSRPLYYLETADGVTFGPELKTFAHLKAGRPALHRNALVAFLLNGRPLSEETYYRGACLLRPGWFLEIQNGLVTKGAYTEYVPASATAADQGIDTFREQLAGLLRSAVRKRMRNVAAAVFPVSGGYDSRGILGCVREVYSGPLSTVSWGTGEDDPQADAAIGRKVAEYFGTQHRFFRRDATHLIEGLERSVHDSDAANADSFIHPHEPALIQELRSSGHPLLFRGDEAFGYRGPAVSAMEAMARVGVCELAQYPGLITLLHPELVPKILEEQHQTYQAIVSSCRSFGDWSITKDWLYLNQRLFRSLNFSHYNKLAILEARNPWFDRDVFRFYAGIPVAYRYDKSLYRATLRFMFPKLMNEIPIAARNSLEPWHDLLRRDTRFLKYARQHLVEEQNPIHDIWRREAIGEWIGGYERGRSADTFSVRAIGAIKPLVRNYLQPVYRMLKRRAPPSFSVRSVPAQEAIGRLLILKLWCDRWG